MSASNVLRAALAAATAIAATVASASPAAAANPPIVALPSATWTGGAASGTSGDLWSDNGANGANWSGGAVPATHLNILSFPDLGAGCDGGATTDTCYTGVDDLGPITVNQLQFSGGRQYVISPTNYDNPGDTVTLEGDAPGTASNVGLTATQPAGSSENQLASFQVPIILGAAQQWKIGAKGIVYVNSISGAYPLALDLSDGYIQANDVRSSALTISGAGELQLDQARGSLEKLPAVKINNSDGKGSALAIASTHARSGSIRVTGTGNNVIVLTDRAPGETRLRVRGNVSFDSTTNLEFDIDGNSRKAGVDYSRLTSSGSVALGGAKFELWQARDRGRCAALTPGRSVTLISARSLRGKLRVGGRLIGAGHSAIETFRSNNCKVSTTRARVTRGRKTIKATLLRRAASRGPRRTR